MITDVMCRPIITTIALRLAAANGLKFNLRLWKNFSSIDKWCLVHRKTHLLQILSGST